MDLTKITITDAISLLKDRKISVSELVEAHIQQIEKHRDLNAFITETFDLARKNAKESEQRYLNGVEKLLDGIPCAVKDIFCTKNTRTTSASKILENFVPTYESTVTEKLFAEGALMVGKTNMDEFAMGSTNSYSYFGQAINPWKDSDGKKLVPGGSSGGSAVAVASGMSIAALGTDTGGSVRQPALFCGLVGFKPSYGRCSRYGIVAFSSSLDQAGVFTRSVDDAALLSQVVMGYDDKDSTCENIDVGSFKDALQGKIRGMRIGIPKECRSSHLDPEIEKLWNETADILRKEGAEVVEVSMPNIKYGVAAYYVIAPAEASSNLARYDGVRYGHRTSQENLTLDQMYELTRGEAFGHEVERRIMMGTFVLSSGSYEKYFAQAQKVRRLIIRDFDDVFADVDVVLTPTATTSAFAIGDKQRMDPISLYYNDVYTIPANMAGLPAVSVPLSLDSKGKPIGLQIVANRFREDLMFRAAKSLENIYNFRKFPGGF
ncbi:MAG: Asp-tRNA(Asn)/Glu-tRNA(Gln) amidotransferase subunit GatA [Rickettsiales bacterium]|nr:Asp-tRNA(Asn)/Glu-tRNA(Gln) amidotransferase subunit GatA [Rickettsiales bacterium]